MRSIIILSLDIFLMGGVERSNSHLAQLFKSKGHVVTLVSFFRASKKPFFCFDGIDLICLENTPLGTGLKAKVKTLIVFFKLLIYLRSRKDDYLVLSTFPRISLLFSILFWDKKRIIACEHSSFNAHNKIIGYSRIALYRQLRCVITLTDHDQKIFAKHKVNAHKIPNFSDFKKELTPRESMSKMPLVCLSAGRMHPHKGFDRLLEIAKDLKEENIQFIIVGSGSEESRIKSLLNDYDLSSSVSIFAASDNLEKFIDNSDVFLMTSTTEAAPLVMLEAFSYSKPIIAYDCPVGPREIIIDGVNGFLVNDGDRLEFVTKLKLLLGSPILYNKLSKGAASYAKENSSNHNYKLWAAHF
jgi:amylovoran biosynthesis glycosyltransferase AmsD